MSTANPPADAQDATTESAEAPALPPLEPMIMFSGPGFPEFVYRFFNKLFRLDRVTHK